MLSELARDGEDPRKQIGQRLQSGAHAQSSGPVRQRGQGQITDSRSREGIDRCEVRTNVVLDRTAYGAPVPISPVIGL
jgi:hypothetical protein